MSRVVLAFWLLSVVTVPCGAAAELEELEAAIATLAAYPDQDSLAYRTNYPYARLQVKKAKLCLRGGVWMYKSDSAERFVQAGLDAAERIRADEPLFAAPGALSELAYIADNDGSAQPYYLYLPNDYSPDRTWPLIVFLHGYVPSISVLDPWVLGDEVLEVAGQNGCMLLIPYGRRNTDFQGVGEVDVLQSMELVKELYPVDPDRIYISGVSMGGMGAWNMFLRHPGLYAAATPMCGHTDMFRWWTGLQPWPPREQVPGFKRWLVEWDNPLDLVLNLRSQHAFVQHGEHDHLIPAAQSRLLVEAAAELGIVVKHHEFEGSSHYIYWDLPCFVNAWSWTKDFTLKPSPPRIDYKTYSLEYDTAFWLTIEDFEQWGKPATVSAQVTEAGGVLSITTENVRLLQVDAETAPLNRRGPIRVVVNGCKRALPADVGGAVDIPISPETPAEGRWPPRKRKGLCGPIEEVFDTPFILVQGTMGSREQDAELAEAVKRWAEEWEAFADGWPRITTDVELSAQDVQRYSLVLFGTPGTNKWVARIAPRLPIRIGDHIYQVGERRYQGESLGLAVCYPNPLAADRYVLILAGEPWGERCAINHKFDLLPDFIIYTTESFAYDGCNDYLCAGFFDMKWELDPQLTWTGKQTP